MNRRFVLRERPTGRIDANTFELHTDPVPPVGIREVMRGWGLGTVIASDNPHHPIGQVVQGLLGWQEYPALGKTGLVAWVGIRQIAEPRPGETVVVSAAARIKPLENVIEGFDRVPSAINMLFDGMNVGKLVVRMSA